MTPSEIAAYFDTMKNGKYGAWATQAAATVRELEDDRDQEIRTREATVELLAETEAKLKIATEALEPIVDEFESTIEQYNKNGPHWTSADGEMFDVGVVLDREPLILSARQALARIKEVG